MFRVWTIRRQAMRPRNGALWLAFVSHLVATFGFPLPFTPPKSKSSSVPFPCQLQPCGCLTSEQCWKGDCCCFTIEEKLDWAQRNGIEPPEHVRPLVASRKARLTPPKMPSCCAEGGPSAASLISLSPTGCEERMPVASHPGGKGPSCQTELVSSHDAAKVTSKCCETKPPREDEPRVYWVAGIFAQKCHGTGPAGLLTLDPTILPDRALTLFDDPDQLDSVAAESDRATPLSHRPPTPPPRLS